MEKTASQQTVLENDWGRALLHTTPDGVVTARLQLNYPQHVLAKIHKRKKKPYDLVMVPFGNLWNDTFTFTPTPIEIAENARLAVDNRPQLVELMEAAARAKWETFAPERAKEAAGRAEAANRP